MPELPALPELPAWVPQIPTQTVIDVLVAIGFLVVGLIVARIASGLVGRVMRRFSAQSVMVARFVTYYGLLGLTIIATLQQLGLDPTVLVGAAGVLTVALGFASQTSASNVISGLFLLGERPFVVGDLVEIEEVTGEVISIDLMSVKLRTFSNVLVRVPNENLLKSRITNLTRFPIRRIDLRFVVPHHVPFERLEGILTRVAEEHPLCLDEPTPMVWFKEFTLDGMQVQFSVWASTPHFFTVQNEIPARMQEALQHHDIPFAARAHHVAVTSDSPA